MYTTKDVIKEVGISRLTLYRWLAAGKIPEVSKDYKHHRIFTRKDINRIKRFKANVSRPETKIRNHSRKWSQEFLALPGAWEDNRSAEEIIKDIYALRHGEEVRDIRLPE